MSVGTISMNQNQYELFWKHFGVTKLKQIRERQEPLSNIYFGKNVSYGQSTDEVRAGLGEKKCVTSVQFVRWCMEIKGRAAFLQTQVRKFIEDDCASFYGYHTIYQQSSNPGINYSIYHSHLSVVLS